MSRIVNIQDWKVSSPEKLQEKVKKEKESEERERQAKEEYRKKFEEIGRSSSFSKNISKPPCKENTTSQEKKSLSKYNEYTPLGSDLRTRISPVSDDDNQTSPRTIEPETESVSRKLIFSTPLKADASSSKQQQKPKLFQNLTFDDIPISNEPEKKVSSKKTSTTSSKVQSG